MKLSCQVTIYDLLKGYTDARQRGEKESTNEPAR